MSDLPRISITYCTQCNWMLRAAWLAQELLQTFGQDLGEVALRPGTGGVFEIRLYMPNGQDELIWERKRDGGFPEAKVLKQRVRDLVWPDRDLGHSDSKPKPE
ncbi:SelT/SelW/SelH family protein [Brucella pituitosa]|uniref:SelT/SelW/SelH family protein n=1 Tax=Brucella pituitosa TaxID=571256 RepID=A0ABS3K5I4_9HYPH|nr:SelT/SelW/SelH family protein [Brucella pituitosa]